MKTSIIIPIAALLLSFTMSKAQDSPLPSELRKQISEWRINTLPTLNADRYWSELKDLGSRVGEANARRVEASQASDTDSALALMAYKAWSQPEKIDEIAGWYGVYEGQVSRELRGVDSDEIWDAMQAGFNVKRTTFIVEELREEHKKAEFLPAWEAWMLSPYSIERRTMRQRMSEALSQIGNEQTTSILVEKYRILPQQYPEGGRLEDRKKHLHAQLSEIRRIISEIGGKSAVLALLQCIRIAETQGELGEGADNVRKITVHALSRTLGREYIEEMESQFPDFHKTYGVPGRPGQYLPVDGKWKEFKPIIEAMLIDPTDLRAEDIRLLQDALAAMPKD